MIKNIFNIKKINRESSRDFISSMKGPNNYKATSSYKAKLLIQVWISMYFYVYFHFNYCILIYEEVK